MRFVLLDDVASVTPGGKVVPAGVYEIDHLQGCGGLVIKFDGSLVPFQWGTGGLHRAQALMGFAAGEPVAYRVELSQAESRAVGAVMGLSGPIRESNKNLIWLVYGRQ